MRDLEKLIPNIDLKKNNVIMFSSREQMMKFLSQITDWMGRRDYCGRFSAQSTFFIVDEYIWDDRSKNFTYYPIQASPDYKDFTIIKIDEEEVLY